MSSVLLFFIIWVRNVAFGLLDFVAMNGICRLFVCFRILGLARDDVVGGTLSMHLNILYIHQS